MPGNSNAGGWAPAQRSTATSTQEVSHASKPGASKAKLTRRQADALKLKRRYSSLEDPLRAALHEASHVAMLQWVGLPWNYAELLPRPQVDMTGHHAAHKSSPACSIFGALAGTACDVICHEGESLPTVDMTGHDMQLAAAFSEYGLGITDPAAQLAWLNAALRVTIRLVGKRWDTIDVLAGRLYTAGRLEPSQCTAPRTTISEAQILAAVQSELNRRAAAC